ncbi:MAG: type II secretion system protein [Candidatus Sumerlaeia bacterium]
MKFSCHGVHRDQLKTHAFTLIEVLFIVAIIGILSAIAIYNFREAHQRAKVARAKSDLATITTALEAYSTDHQSYPYPISGASRPGLLQYVWELSTPIAYLSSVSLSDSFQPEWYPFEKIAGGGTNPPKPDDYAGGYRYVSYSGWFGDFEKKHGPPRGPYPFPGFCIVSCGPDRLFNGVEFYPPLHGLPNQNGMINLIYDPTNGTVSRGDIARMVGKAIE